MPVSVLILTLNEEINLASCLKSVDWSDDVVVFDSYSTDRTIDIGKEAGARVVQRRFDNWSAHQNWAMENIEFRNPWVLYLDADERCPSDLAAEIQSIVVATSNAAFRLRRKDYFMGQWLRRAQLYPTWLVRLFRPEAIRFERLVNPVPVVSGNIGKLDGHLYHSPFSHGIRHWVARHNGYSDMEAEEYVKLLDTKQVSLVELFSRDPNLRRMALKNVFYFLPARPLAKFIYYYIGRRGFLEGRAGLTYSLLQSYYEYLIVIKTRELVRRQKGLPV